MIKIEFEKVDSTGLLVYRDALYLPEDHTFTDDQIEAMKQERFNRWYDIVMNPPITTNEESSADIESDTDTTEQV